MYVAAPHLIAHFKTNEQAFPVVDMPDAMLWEVILATEATETIASVRGLLVYSLEGSDALLHSSRGEQTDLLHRYSCSAWATRIDIFMSRRRSNHPMLCEVFMYKWRKGGGYNLQLTSIDDSNVEHTCTGFRTRFYWSAAFSSSFISHVLFVADSRASITLTEGNYWISL